MLASAGDSILVGPGTYVESVELPVDLVVLGEGGASVTTLDAGGLPFCVWTAGTLLGSVVEGFTLIGARQATYGSEGYAVQGRGNLRVENCVVGTAMEPMGVACWGGEGALRLAGSYVSAVGNGQRYNVEFSGLDGDSIVVEDCVFESRGSTIGAVGIHGFGSAIVRRCAFWEVETFGGSAPVIGYTPVFGTTPGLQASIVVEECVFVGSGLPVVGEYNVPLLRRGGARRAEAGQLATLKVMRCTFARNLYGPFGDGMLPLPFAGSFEENVVTGGSVGIALPDSGVSFTISCNDVFGNGANWSGVPDLTGVDGNISQAPLFCDPDSGDFSLSQNSPCLPANNACGIRMGAFDEGCGATAVESESWGRIKAGFRGQ
jgi:hypothetical protein